MIVCEIATTLLPDPRREQVITLAKAYTGPDGERHDELPYWCTFADKARTNAKNGAAAWARFAEFSHWHFLNLPRNAHHVDPAECHDDCVLKAIAFHRERLALPTLSLAERAEALILLAHWVGDVHQPLHISYKDDIGGNSINRIQGRYYPSEHLHSVWDTGIIRKARGSRKWPKYARDLAATIDGTAQNSWAQSEPIAWAEESYAITTEDDVRYCHWHDEKCRSMGPRRTLRYPYQSRFQPTVETRLKQAGVRLARLIDTALADMP